MKRTFTDTEQFTQIQDWFLRHRHDYNAHDDALPPNVWSEYFLWLIKRVQALEHAERISRGEIHPS
jgi:hypothetical protein